MNESRKLIAFLSAGIQLLTQIGPLKFCKIRLLFLQFVLCLIPSAFLVETQGASLLVGKGAGTTLNDDHYYYGGSRWTNMTQEINSVFDTVTVVPELIDRNLMLSYDRLWVDSRAFHGPLLSAVEVDNIRAFIATGRRVVLMGENGDWWSSQILGIVGGTWAGYGTGIGAATALPVVPELTGGVGAIDFSQNAFGQSAGGTPLFDRPWSALWGANVVTALDVNVWSDYLPLRPNANLRYARNVLNWLVVAEPTSNSILLMACIVVLPFVGRRHATGNLNEAQLDL